MYNLYLKVQPSKTGFGIFTTTKIPAKTPIIEFQGNICTEDKLPPDNSIYLQIGPGRFLTPTGGLTGVDFINHSCDPNCTMRVAVNRAILYSLYIIPAGAELTFDYSTTSTDTLANWQMQCSCGSPKCRGTISGHQYLSQEQQKDYKERGLLPLFITNPNLFPKKW